jgi:hypothetical protein
MATFMARKDALFQSIGRFSPGLADTGQFLQVSEFLLHTGKIYLQGLSFETFNLVPAVFFGFLHDSWILLGGYSVFGNPSANTQ